MSLQIEELPNQKKDIFQRSVMTSGIIPKHPSVCLFSGRSGSGKTNLMLSLLTRPQFYGGDDKKRHYFDHIILMGSTVDSDDLYEILKSQQIQIETVLEPTADSIQQVLDYQKQQIKELGIAKAPRTLLVLEDMQTHSAGKDSVMRSRAFLECFLPTVTTTSLFGWQGSPTQPHLVDVDCRLVHSSILQVQKVSLSWSPRSTVHPD
jgi:hypothetical protein